MNGVADEKTSNYHARYYKNNEVEKLFVLTSRKNTVNIALDYTNDNPFNRNRIFAKLILTNGNGTLTVELLDVQYDDIGVFNLDFESFSGDAGNLNITLDVQGLIS